MANRYEQRESGKAKNRYERRESSRSQNRYERRSSSTSPAGELAALNAEVEATGAGTFKDTAWTAARTVGDLISRGNYAAAGVAEELLTPQGGGLGAAVRRAGSEIFSGLGGIKGQKENFSEVMEQAGVGTLGQLSDVVPFIKPGSAVDITGRGFLGLVGDIGLDPTTYVGLGGVGKLTKAGKAAAEVAAKTAPVQAAARVTAAKSFREATERAVSFVEAPRSLAQKNKEYGVLYQDALKKAAQENVEAAARAGAKGLVVQAPVRFMGKEVPGTAALNLARANVTADVAAALSNTSAGQAALAATADFRKWASKTTESAIRLFVPGRDVRAFKGVFDAERRMSSFVASNIHRWGNEVAALSKKYGLSDLEKAQVTRAIDEGNLSGLKSKKLQDAAFEAQTKFQEMLAFDRSKGLEYPEVPNYVKHAYTGDADKIKAKLWTAQKKWVVKYGDDGFMEERHFDTLRDAELHGLTPNYDIWDLLRMRGEDSIKAAAFRDYHQKLSGLVGADNLWSAGTAFDLAMRGKRVLPQGEDIRIAEILAYPSRRPDPIRATMQKIAETPEVRVAKRRLNETLAAAPLKYVERQTLKNLDEVRYYRRRGWDIVEDNTSGVTKYIAQRPREVGTQEYKTWAAALNRSRNELAAATKRARRDVTVRIPLTYTPKSQQIARLSDEGKRAYFEERFSRFTGVQEALDTIAKYGDDFGKFFPAENMDWRLDPTGKPWSQIKFKGVGDVNVPEDVAARVATARKTLLDTTTPDGKAFYEAVLQPFQWVTNAFKYGVTMFPAFIARNQYNNVAQSFLKVGVSIFDDDAQRLAVAALRNHPGTLKTAYGELDLAALKRVAEERGVILSNDDWLELAGEKAGSKVQKGLAATAAGGVAGGMFLGPVGAVAGAALGAKYAQKFGQAVRATNMFVENSGRMAHFIAEIKSGKTIDDAVASVNETLVDYSNLTKTERELFRTIFPFYTWQKNNIAFQLKTLATNPGRPANLIKPFRGREAENQHMATWEAGGYKIRLNGDGKTVDMIAGVDLPIRNLDILWRGSWGKTLMGVMGMMAPPLKVPLEVGVGQSFFTGRDFDRATSPTLGRIIKSAPKLVQNWLGYKEKPDAAGRTKYTFEGERFYLLTQSWMFSRIFSTSDRQFREYLEADGGSGAKAFLDFMTGLRVKRIDLTEEQKKRVYEAIKMAQDALVRAGEKKRVEIIYTPKDK